MTLQEELSRNARDPEEIAREQRCAADQRVRVVADCKAIEISHELKNS